MFTRGRSGGPRSATTELAGDPIRSPVERRSPGRAVAEHFDAVSGVYYEMVDAYRTDLGYYHARELEEAERWARALQPARILDAGSGPGRHTRRVLILGLETVSVDVSRNMLRELVGERAGSDAPATARPVQGDIRSLPFRSTAFDFIVCMEVIEHLPSFPGDVQRAALELTRSLRPGGHLILEFPLRLHSLLRRFPRSTVDWNRIKKREWYRSSPPPLRYQRRFSLARVERIARRRGLRVKERMFVRIIPSGYVDRFPQLQRLDRILEKVPLIRLFAREAILVLQKEDPTAEHGPHPEGEGP